jgi:hypothetical protein
MAHVMGMSEKFSGQPPLPKKRFKQAIALRSSGMREKVWPLIAHRTFYSSVLFLNIFGDLLRIAPMGDS